MLRSRSYRILSKVLDNKKNKTKDKLEKSKTFKLRLSSINTPVGRVLDKIDGKEAVRQAIAKLVFTDRYKYKIYSGNYGIDLDQYIGKDLSYISVDLPKEINRALKYDDRVLAIEDFSLYRISTDECFCKFVVRTIYGEIEMEGVL